MLLWPSNTGESHFMSYYSFKSIILFLVQDNALTSLKTKEESKAGKAGGMYVWDCLETLVVYVCLSKGERTSTIFKALRNVDVISHLGCNSSHTYFVVSCMEINHWDSLTT